MIKFRFFTNSTNKRIHDYMDKMMIKDKSVTKVQKQYGFNGEYSFLYSNASHSENGHLVLGDIDISIVLNDEINYMNIRGDEELRVASNSMEEYLYINYGGFSKIVVFSSDVEGAISALICVDKYSESIDSFINSRWLNNKNRSDRSYVFSKKPVHNHTEHNIWYVSFASYIENYVDDKANDLGSCFISSCRFTEHNGVGPCVAIHNHNGNIGTKNESFFSNLSNKLNELNVELSPFYLSRFPEIYPWDKENEVSKILHSLSLVRMPLDDLYMDDVIYASPKKFTIYSNSIVYDVSISKRDYYPEYRVNAVSDYRSIEFDYKLTLDYSHRLGMKEFYIESDDVVKITSPSSVVDYKGINKESSIFEANSEQNQQLMLSVYSSATKDIIKRVIDSI